MRGDAVAWKVRELGCESRRAQHLLRWASRKKPGRALRRHCAKGRPIRRPAWLLLLVSAPMIKWALASCVCAPAQATNRSRGTVDKPARIIAGRCNGSRSIQVPPASVVQHIGAPEFPLHRARRVRRSASIAHFSNGCSLLARGPRKSPADRQPGSSGGFQKVDARSPVSGWKSPQPRERRVGTSAPPVKSKREASLAPFPNPTWGFGFGITTRHSLCQEIAGSPWHSGNNRSGEMNCKARAVVVAAKDQLRRPRRPSVSRGKARRGLSDQ